MIENDLLHHGKPDTLSDAAFQLAYQLDRVEHATNVLGSGNFHDAHQAEIEVDVDDCAVGGEGKRDEGIALAVRVEFRGGGVVELHGLF
jgi:hypothetical protein